METIIKVTNLIIFIIIISSPILTLILLKKRNSKNDFLSYLALSTLLFGVQIAFFAWWSNESKVMLLNHYGYNFEAMNDVERFQNVLPQNQEKVNSIEISIMGIGWPLKAIFGFIILFPYFLIVFLMKYVIVRIYKTIIISKNYKKYNNSNP